MKSIKKFRLLLTVCLLLLSGSVFAHGIQVRWHIAPNGNIRVWIEHWHGDVTNVSSYPLDVTITANGSTSSTTYYATGYANNTTLANLPNGGGSSTLLSECTGISRPANSQNDWVYWDFAPPACNTPVILTIDNGSSSTTTEGCSNLYPQTITSSFTDVTGPVVTVSDITVPATNSCLSAVVSSFGVTATDACGGTPSLAYSIAEGSSFNVGSTSVTATGTDASNNTTVETFNVIVQPDSYTGTATDVVCSGDAFTFPDNHIISNITSQVSHTWTILRTNGCDSTVTTTVNVNPTYNQAQTGNICYDGSYTFPDGVTVNNIIADTVYTSSLTTIHTSCDSVIMSTITVDPVYNQSNTYNVCYDGSYTFPDGVTVSNIIANTVHTSSLTTVHTSCDSIIVDSIYVRPVYAQSNNYNVCYGDTFTFPDGSKANYITNQVIHVSNLTTAGYACDSIITDTIHVQPEYNQTQTADVCYGSSYTFPDGSTQSNITTQVIYTSNLTTKVFGCDSVIVSTVSVDPIYNQTQTADVCYGSGYTFPDGVTINNIIADTVYTSNLTTVHTGCDSVIVSTISVDPVYNQSNTYNVCYDGSYTFPDGVTVSNIIANTVHTSSLTTIHTSCDSIIVDSIYVRPVYAQSNNYNVCYGDTFTFPDGSKANYITNQVIHISNLTTAGYACDSIITDTIHVQPEYNQTQTADVCYGSSYTFPDGSTQSNITTQVIYTSNLTTKGFGCDSIIVSTVSVDPIYNQTQTADVCYGSGYTFPDGITINNIIADTVYTSNLTTVHTGCDSVIVSTISVDPVYNQSNTYDVCYNDSYTFPDGVTFSEIIANMVHTSNLTTIHTGCDSIIVDSITVRPVYAQSNSYNVCYGDTFTFPDGLVASITEQLIHVSNLTTVGFSCDSIITDTILVQPVYNQVQTANVCYGDSYIFPDGSSQSNITAQVVYTSNLTTKVFGCDSVIVSTISVDPIYNQTQTADVCYGSSYTFPDGVTVNNIIADTVYTSNLTTIHTGCDSVIVSTISVDPVYNQSNTYDVCYNGSYTFPDGVTINTIISDIVHTSNLTTIHTGCDSVIVDSIYVQTVHLQGNAYDVCSGDTFIFPDGFVASNITSQIIHTSNLSTVGYSCDSIIVDTIHVYPVYNQTQFDTVCYNGSFTLPDGTYMDSIPASFTYTSSLSTVGHSCDSTIVSAVYVRMPKYDVQYLTLCFGGSYSIGTSSYAANGVYIDTIPTTVGCDSIVTTHIVVTEDLGQPIYPQLDTLVGVTIPGATYRWLECSSYSAVPGETGNMLKVLSTGLYALETTKGACVDTSHCSQITLVENFPEVEAEGDHYSGAAEKNGSKYVVVFEQAQANLHYQLINSGGVIILDVTLQNEDGFILNLSSYPSGTYFLKVEADGPDHIAKIVR